MPALTPNGNEDISSTSINNSALGSKGEKGGLEAIDRAIQT